jgi:hypothetical protein
MQRLHAPVQNDHVHSGVSAPYPCGMTRHAQRTNQAREATPYPSWLHRAAFRADQLGYRARAHHARSTAQRPGYAVLLRIVAMLTAMVKKSGSGSGSGSGST